MARMFCCYKKNRSPDKGKIQWIKGQCVMTGNRFPPKDGLQNKNAKSIHRELNQAGLLTSSATA